MENVKNRTLQEILREVSKKQKPLKIKIENLPSNSGAQYLPNGEIILDDEILSDGKIDNYEASKVVHELTHAIEDENYLDQEEELEAYKNQIKFLLETGVNVNSIVKMFLPVFDDYKDINEATEILAKLIEKAQKELSIKTAQLTKVKDITITFNPDELRVITAIKDLADELKINVFLAGGLLRDRILGIPNSDLDFVTNEKSEELAMKLAQKYNLSTPIKMDRSGATMAHFEGKNLDFIDAEKVFSPLKPTLEKGQEAEMSIFLDDAFRRDLTINSLLYNIKTGELLDPTGKGVPDIKNHIIRTIIDPNLKYRFAASDMLRAIRFFATKPDFKFAPGMLEAMKANAHKLKPRNEHGDISIRRIERELRKANTWGEWSKMKQVLQEVGLSKYIGKQIQDVDSDKKGDVNYNFDKMSQMNLKTIKFAQINEQQVQGPNVIIEPSLQIEIQDAVNELKKNDPSFFSGVSKIVALSGSPFGQVSSEDPTIIHLNLNKIKQEVKTQVGSSYNPNDAEHKKAFDEAVKRSIIETISHEKGHIETYDSNKNQFVGGEAPAESKSKQTMQRMQLDKPVEIKSSFKTFYKKATHEWIDEISGGLGDDRLPSEFSEDQLTKGLIVELEHTNDPKIALEITIDHLVENDHYYDYLEEMEQKFEEDKIEKKATDYAGRPIPNDSALPSYNITPYQQEHSSYHGGEILKNKKLDREEDSKEKSKKKVK